MNIWIIADTHFYHENIKKYQDRPDDFNEQIIKNWNRLVKYDDVVIHLGDVIFGTDKEQRLPSLLAALVADKRIVNWNIHGHFHTGHRSAPQETGEQRVYKDRYYNSEYYKAYKEKYVLVHIDETLTPVALDEILNEKKI